MKSISASTEHDGAKGLALRLNGVWRYLAAGTTRHLDRNMLLVSTWLMLGIFMDGWAHNHVAETIDSFFTPWHAVLYSGFLSVAALTAVIVYVNRRRGLSWKRVIPEGYGLSLAGVVLFGVSGMCDMIWHLLFGIEVKVEAVFSPPHLGIMIAVGMIVSGPFRAAWRRSDGASAGWVELSPAVYSIFLTLSLMTFVTQFANPLVVLQAATLPTGFTDVERGLRMTQALGGVSILLHGAFFMGWILMAARRWRLPVGALTLILALNASAMSFMRDQYFLIPAAAMAGLCGDGMLRILRPSPARPTAFRLFAFLAPVIYFGLYFAQLLMFREITWSVPLWTGTALMSGVVSVLLSCLVVPPACPAQAEVMNGAEGR